MGLVPGDGGELTGGKTLSSAVGDQPAIGRFQSGAARRILFAMAGTVAASHFVGRVAELGRLHTAFESVRVGDPVTLCVGGEAGVGKTRLVTRFAEQVREASGRVLLAGPGAARSRPRSRTRSSGGAGRSRPGTAGPHTARARSGRARGRVDIGPSYRGLVVSGQAVRGVSGASGAPCGTVPDGAGD